MDFVQRWSEKAEIGVGRFIAWLGVTGSKFYAPELSNIKSNGKIRSVSDIPGIPGTTVILTLMGKLEDRYLILRSFDIKFKTGQSIHCEGPFERTKGMGWEPAYRYTFPAQEE
jgi:hypothetical protein